MKPQLLGALAGLSLAAVVVGGSVVGMSWLPVAAVHVQRGSIPDGMALRIDLDPQVQLRVVSTAAAGGEPRYEYRTTSFAEPLPNPLEGRVISAHCITSAWPGASDQGCHGELLVVVTAGRPLRVYCPAKALIPHFDADILVEENTCPY